MYAKVFSSLWQGSLYGHRDPQLVFIYLLAHCGRDGHVRAVPQAIAAATGMTVDDVESALALLEATDPDSNTTTEDGRRLERLSPGRWFIVNYLKYRGMRDENDRQTQNREAQARYKSKQRSAKVSHGKPQSAYAEGEGDAEGEAEARKSKPLRAARAVAVGFQEFYQASPRKKDPRGAERAYRAALSRGHTPAALLAGIQRYAAEVAGREPDKIKYPASWLNADAVLDEPDGPAVSSDAESITERIQRKMEEMSRAPVV